MFRELVAVAWIVIDAVLNVSFLYFLWAQTHSSNRNRDSILAAGALLTYFCGATLSRIYGLLGARIITDVPTELEPYYPIAVVGAVVGLVGAVWSAFVFAPRQYRPVLMGGALVACLLFFVWLTLQ